MSEFTTKKEKEIRRIAHWEVEEHEDNSWVHHPYGISLLIIFLVIGLIGFFIVYDAVFNHPNLNSTQILEEAGWEQVCVESIGIYDGFDCTQVSETHTECIVKKGKLIEEKCTRYEWLPSQYIQQEHTLSADWYIEEDGEFV